MLLKFLQDFDVRNLYCLFLFCLVYHTYSRIVLITGIKKEKKVNKKMNKG